MAEFDALADAILNDREIPTSEQANTVDTGTPAPNTPPATTSPETTVVDPANAGSAAATDPNNVPNPNPSTADASNWISNVAKIAGVEFKTEDDLKNFIEKAKSAQDLESQHSTLSQQYQELKASQVQFANDKIQKLNELYAKGATEDQIEAFHKIQAAGDLSQLKPIDAVKLALQLRDGLTPEEADIRIKNTYKLDDSVYDSDVIVASNVDLKLDSKKDLEYLEQHKVKVSTAPAIPTAEEAYAASQAALDKEITEYKAKAAPIINSIKDEFTAIKGVNVNGKQGEDALLIDLPVSEDGKAKLNEWITDYAAANNIPLTQEGITHLKEYARKTLILQNFDAIAIDINNKAEERIRTEYNNPANINRGNDAPNTQASDRATKLQNFVLNDL